MEILGLVDVPIAWLVAVAVLSVIYGYGKWRNQYFTRLGISGPAPTIYLGNLHNIIKMGVRFDNPLGKKYGKVYGVMMGGIPSLRVSDREMIKEILLKRFQSFPDRLSLDLDDYPFNRGIFFEKGAKWKHLRAIVSPTFSSAKLRLMCDEINSCSKTLQRNFIQAAQKDIVIDIKDYFGAFTMDTIACTAFGIEVDSQNDMNNNFIRQAKRIFAEVSIGQPATFIAFMFPGLAPLLKKLGISSMAKQPMAYFTQILLDMLEQRKSEISNFKKRKDFLQLLIDAEDTTTNGADGNTNKSEETEKKVLPWSWEMLRTMSIDEILGQALLFFIAGYDTTAGTLHFIAYSLATNPDAQERLIEEIDTVLGESEPDYDNIGKLTYLDYVISETLRLYPVVAVLSRVAAETVTIKGYTVPKGCVVTIPTFLLQRDPDVFDDPHSFKPERTQFQWQIIPQHGTATWKDLLSPFDLVIYDGTSSRWESKSEIDPMNYLPFGHGPRQCIGMRLALVEMKMVLVHVLRKVKFAACEETKIPLVSGDFKIGAVFTTKKPLRLKVKLR